MSSVEIDDKARAALARLTAGEKECLRRKLGHQTAKEIALDLGVSPHAVEKRLKMARAKLGLSSSLEAARLLVASERYQRTAPQAADLASDARRGKRWPITPAIIGTIVMSLVVATLVLLAQQGGVAPLEAGGVAPLQAAGVAPLPGSSDSPVRAMPSDAGPAIREDYAEDDFVEATSAEIGIIVRDTFAHLDRNRSGYIEPEEGLVAGPGVVVRNGYVERTVYRRDAEGNARPTGDVNRIELRQAGAEYIARGDGNGDGKLDFIEFQRWQTPIMARRGIPKAWKDDINRPIGE